MNNERLRITLDVAGQLVVSGVVDLVTAPALQRALEHAARADNQALVVDLQQVSVFQAAGVAVLFGQAARGPLKVVLRSGSATAKVCAVCSLAEVAEVEIRQSAARPVPAGTTEVVAIAPVAL